jgi:hypothetical protein
VLARPNSKQLAAPTWSRVDSKAQFFGKMHATFLGDAAYLHVSQQMSLPQELLEAANLGALSFPEQMHPKDALESLALTQALLAHSRAAWLTKLLTNQSDVNSLGVISDACEHASSTFGRLMRAIAEYRRPAACAPTVSIAQANVANQQIIQNGAKLEAKNKNGERTRIGNPGAAVTTKVLPANAKGAAVPARLNSTNETLGKKYGT